MLGFLKLPKYLPLVLFFLSIFIQGETSPVRKLMVKANTVFHHDLDLDNKDFVTSLEHKQEVEDKDFLLPPPLAVDNDDVPHTRTKRYRKRSPINKIGL
ncbi:unnamed protein product [Orchesella dallaii]|uniref:Uncharacterized protein n=1 Tax=Orchesella dallaii TaxID=48710 RepID=A0ABP1S7I0_9HEXA